MTDKSSHHFTTIFVLLVLTVATTAVVSTGRSVWLAVTVLTIALAKIQLVAFRFMDLRDAHLFWKGAFVFITIALVVILAVLARG